MTDDVSSIDDARVQRLLSEAIRADAMTTAWTDDDEPGDLVDDLQRARDLFEDIAECQHCHEPIPHGQPYMGRIPFVGSWGGFVHRHCRPQLRVVRGGGQ